MMGQERDDTCGGQGAGVESRGRRPHRQHPNSAVEAEMRLYLDKLREIVPHIPRNRKVTRLELIQHVIDYICDLQHALEDHPSLKDEHTVRLLTPPTSPHHLSPSSPHLMPPSPHLMPPSPHLMPPTANHALSSPHLMPPTANHVLQPIHLQNHAHLPGLDNSLPPTHSAHVTPSPHNAALPTLSGLSARQPLGIISATNTLQQALTMRRDVTKTTSRVSTISHTLPGGT